MAKPSRKHSGSDNVLKKTMMHLLPRTVIALKRWAAAENRSMSAQARVVFDDVIPPEFYDEESS